MLKERGVRVLMFALSLDGGLVAALAAMKPRARDLKLSFAGAGSRSWIVGKIQSRITTPIARYAADSSSRPCLDEVGVGLLSLDARYESETAVVAAE